MVIYCKDCDHCKYHKKDDWYECRISGEETGNYDTCEEAKDIVDDYDNWRDEPYERKKYAVD